MLDFIIDNSNWLVPVIVAIIGGVFGLFAYTGARSRQKIKNVKDSTITQINSQGDKHGR